MTTEENLPSETPEQTGTEGQTKPEAEPQATASQPAPPAPSGDPKKDVSATPTESSEDDDEEDFGKLLDNYLPDSNTQSRREIVDVTVVAINEDHVLVAAGGKEEARINLSEFPLINGERKIKEGDVIQAKSIGPGRFSHRQVRQAEAEKALMDAKEHNVPVRGTISRVVKGGLMVDVGLDAFMPASQVDLFKVPNLESLVGQEIEAIVLEYDPRRKRAVLSRRQVLFERRESERQDFIRQLVPGSIVKGTVKNALDFGVFVNLGVVDGFIPRDEVSYDRGTPPAEILKTGDEVEVKVLNAQPETGKVTLSRKNLKDDPWEKILEKYPKESTQRGTVASVQGYGVFVHLEEGITGMIHVGDLTWDKEGTKVNPNKLFKEGDEIETKVLDVDLENRRLSLGYKQLFPDPWKEIAAEFPEGSVHKGKVTSLENYGAFVRLADKIEGLVHISEMTWEKRPGYPKDYLTADQEVEVKVLKLDNKERRISLGMKQLLKSPFDDYLESNPVNSVVTGEVSRFAPFGAFVELAPGLEGLIHISEIDENRVELPEKALQLRQEVTVKIIKVEREKQKISLSRKAALKAVERENVKKYLNKGKDVNAGTNLGDLIQQARGNQDN